MQMNWETGISEHLDDRIATMLVFGVIGVCVNVNLFYEIFEI